MPKPVGALFSLSASGKLGGHRRRRAEPEPVPPEESGVPDMFPHTSGRYYTSPIVADAGTTLSTALNEIQLIPFVVPITGFYDRIGVRQTGAGATNYRFGIYGPFTGNITGAALILDTGVVATAGAAVVEATINQELTAGWYLLAAIADATRTRTAAAVASVLKQLGEPGAALISRHTFAIVNQAFGSLPNPLPAVTYVDNIVLPVIFLRKT